MRIWSGRPHFGQDIRDRDLPQETGQQRALNFKKGCYIGQEIVERIRARGSVHREFVGFLVESGSVTAGQSIERDGRKLVEITSVAELPLGGRTQPVALGYVRREAGEAGATIEVEGARLKITAVPFSGADFPQHTCDNHG
jgi:aminomethyltransferase